MGIYLKLFRSLFHLHYLKENGLTMLMPKHPKTGMYLASRGFDVNKNQTKRKRGKP